MSVFADAELSARLERLNANEMRRFVTTARAVDPASDAAALEVAGGVAVYLGAGSPVNQCVGMGLAGAVEESDILEVERFYASHGTRGLAIVSPLSDHSLLAKLGSRGWVADGFENVLVRQYAAGDHFEVAAGVEIVEALDDELRALWAHVAALGFSAPLEPLPAQLALARIVASRPGTRLLMAFVDGSPAGTGELFVEDGVAWLSGDTTLPHLRRRGAQRALQVTRLAMGKAAGCEFAVSESHPGSPSQRNMERLGFRVVYTRVDVLAPNREG